MNYQVPDVDPAICTEQPVVAHDMRCNLQYPGSTCANSHHPPSLQWHNPRQPLLLNDSKKRGRFKGAKVGLSAVSAVPRNAPVPGGAFPFLARWKTGYVIESILLEGGGSWCSEASKLSTHLASSAVFANNPFRPAMLKSAMGSACRRRAFINASLLLNLSSRATSTEVSTRPYRCIRSCWIEV